MKRTTHSILLGFFAISACINVNAADFTYYAINSAPASFLEGGKIRGYYAEILQKVAAELGQPDAKVNMAPYPKIAHALNSNTSGFVLTCLFPSKKFKDLVQQPSKVAHFETGVISMAKSPFTWENAKGKKVATVKGASAVYGKKFHDMTTSGEITLVSVNDYNQAIKMMEGGRIDGFAGNLGPLLKDIKKRNIAIAEPAVITEKISFITVSVAPGTPDADATVAKIKGIVEGMLASGEIQDLIEGYLPDAKQPR